MALLIMHHNTRTFQADTAVNLTCDLNQWLMINAHHHLSPQSGVHISYHTIYHSGPGVNLLYFANVYSKKICIMVLKNSFVKIIWPQNL